MDRVFNLGDSLELLILNDINQMSQELLQRVTAATEEGEQLQRTVFAEQGVPDADKRVLLAKDTIGSADTKPQLDGSSPHYHMLYLVNDGRVVGMRATEELDIKGLGHIVLDYLPPLVPQAEADRVYLIKTGGRQGMLGLFREMTPVQILWSFTGHLTGPQEVVARFTDGIGISRQHLADNGYLKSEVSILVPPQDAETREDYLRVQDEQVGMFGKPIRGDELKLSKKAADRLFVQKYLKDGYIDRDKLREARLRINEVPCVVRTRESIQEATGIRRHIAFYQIS
jgi:hypothetical protein